MKHIELLVLSATMLNYKEDNVLPTFSIRLASYRLSINDIELWWNSYEVVSISTIMYVSSIWDVNESTKKEDRSMDSGNSKQSQIARMLSMLLPWIHESKAHSNLLLIGRRTCSFDGRFSVIDYFFGAQFHHVWCVLLIEQSRALVRRLQWN